MPQKHQAYNDPRWGDQIPWSLSYAVNSKNGDFASFCELIGRRLSIYIDHKEGSIKSGRSFVERLEIESVGRFKANHLYTSDEQVRRFFSPETLGQEQYNGKSFSAVIEVRLDVLQAFLYLASQCNGSIPTAVVRDIRRIAAESGVMLDMKGDPPILVPLEEPLLQREVTDKLLPRLEAKFPARAAELLSAYKLLLKGDPLNHVFRQAYQALETLAQEMTGNTSLVLDDQGQVRKHFPGLHGTIVQTIAKLAAHRGDQAAHGGKAPNRYEIRYLLCSVCNIALLLLECREHHEASKKNIPVEQ